MGAHRFGVLINPTAGHGRGKARGAQVLAEFEARGLHALNLTRPDPRAAFEHAQACRSEYDVLVVVGGDGMAHMGINLIAGTTTPLGLIPVGSGNDFARHLRLPVHDVPAAVETLLAALEAGPQPIDAVKLAPDLGHEWPRLDYPAPHRWAACVVSAGFDSQVNSRANTYRWPRGMGRYLRGVFRELRTFRPYPYRIDIDGNEETFAGTLVAVANAPSFGGGMRIAPAARVNSGELDVVIAGRISRLGLLRVFPKVYAGTHISHPAVRVIAAREVRIAGADGGEIPAIYADGEFVGTGPARAQIHSGVVQMLCPRLET